MVCTPRLLRRVKAEWYIVAPETSMLPKVNWLAMALPKCRSSEYNCDSPVVPFEILVPVNAGLKFPKSAD